MENTALAVVPQHAIQPAAFFTPDQEQMILRDFLGGASKDEAMVLLEIVKRRRLDPFSRQVYFVKRYDSQKRREVWAIQTSIDGLRTIAERTGKYDGQDEPVYGEDEAGKFCKVKVYRKDWTNGRGAVGVAYFTEFVQTKNDGTVTKFWKEKPRLMLAKCAEALAIRKAFPEDTAGIYIPEEMPDPAPARPLAPAPASDPEPAAAPADPAANVAAAAEVLGAKVEPMTTDLLWKLCQEDYGPDATPAWKRAAVAVFGKQVPAPKDWPQDKIDAVERELFGGPTRATDDASVPF